MLLRRLAVVVGLASLGCVAISLCIRFGSRHFLFHASREITQPEPAGFVVRTLRADDGVVVHALDRVVPGSNKTIVYFHNNRDNAERAAGMGNELVSRGYSVVLVEYRGYGNSASEAATEQGLYLDASAVLDMLAARGVDRERVILWGVSLGTGVAAEMAARGRGAQLVLVTPYTSIPDLVRNAIPFLPAGLLLRDRFETLSKADRIHVPTLVIHGDADEVVPFGMARAIAGAISGAHLLRVTGGHHGDLFLREKQRLLDEFVHFAH